MRVHIIEPFEEGAMIQISHTLANALSEGGHEVHVVGSATSEVASLTRGYELVEAFSIRRRDRALVGETGLLSKARWFVLRAWAGVVFVAQYARAARQIRSDGSDLVIVSTVFRYPFIGQFLRYAKGGGAELAQICHEFQLREENPTALDKVVRWANRGAYRHFEWIITLSEYQQRAFRAAFTEVEAARVVCIPLPNGDIFKEFAAAGDDPGRTRRELGLDQPQHANYLLFFGRIRADKGVADLLQAYAALGDEPRRPTLVLAGHCRPSYLAELRNLIAELGLEGVILADGYVASSDVWELVSHAGIVVLPYRSASQSMALQVALSAGRPVVATTAGGLPEVVSAAGDGGAFGLLVEPESPDQLAEAIATLLASPERASEMGASGAEAAATRYGWDRFAATLVDIVGADADGGG